MRRSEELRCQAQVPGAEASFLAHFPQGCRQESPVVVDMAARSPAWVRGARNTRVRFCRVVESVVGSFGLVAAVNW